QGALGGGSPVRLPAHETRRVPQASTHQTRSVPGLRTASGPHAPRRGYAAPLLRRGAPGGGSYLPSSKERPQAWARPPPWYDAVTQGSRRAAKSMRVTLAAPRSGVREGYRLPAAATSAEPPIVYGHRRPIADGWSLPGPVAH